MAANGNQKIVKALEKLLDKARQGKHGYIVGLMVGLDQEPYGFWGGSIPLEAMAAAQLRDLSAFMDKEAGNKTLPPRAPDVPADRVCYNMPISPMSYDFVNWIINAEMTRRIEGAPAPLKVGFWHGRDGKTDGIEGEEARQQMFDGVVRPLLGLVGAVEDASAIDGRFDKFFSSRETVARFNAGHEVPKFHAPADKLKVMAARYPYAPITITLREAKTYSFRNSNMDAWLQFATRLKDRGENVIFVRDTARSDTPIDGFEICPEASLDLHWRMALYENAKMNLFVSNGPAALAHFSDFPWMMFLRPESDDSEYAPNTPKFWREQVGIEIGGQFPWSRPNQRIVWKSDDYENLIEAWHGMGRLAA